jgi:HK97 family phage major capsid protein
MNEGIASQGGVLVPEELADILISLKETYGVFRKNVMVWPMKSDTVKLPRRTGGITVYSPGESSSITASQPTLDQVQLVARKVAGLVQASNELFDDSTVIALGDFIANEFAWAFAKTEDDCGFNGDGTSSYFGITGVRSALTNLSGTIANIAGLVVATGTGYGTSYDSITGNDLSKVVGKLPQYAYAAPGGAKWYCSQAFYGSVLDRLLAAGGGNTYQTLSDGIPTLKYKGFPVEIAQVMPSNSATSQVALLFGNLGLAAKMGERKGLELQTSNIAGTSFQNDETWIRGIERFDIVVHDVGNASATASARLAGPMVGLITASS